VIRIAIRFFFSALAPNHHKLIRPPKPVIPTEASPRLFFAFASSRTHGLAQWRDLGVIEAPSKIDVTPNELRPPHRPFSENFFPVAVS
jgi:hypothetical protein